MSDSDITQRKNTMAFPFYALALLLFLRSEESTRHRTLLYRSAVASFLLSMLGKSAGAPLPMVLLLIAWWKRGRVERRDACLRSGAALHARDGVRPAQHQPEEVMTVIPAEELT